jgi:hypothetical protein
LRHPDEPRQFRIAMSGRPLGEGDSPCNLHTVSKLGASVPDTIGVNTSDDKESDMKKLIITSLTMTAMGAAALGLAATAAAVPNAGTAGDIVSELAAEGYRVQTNGSVTAPLSSCRVTDVHGTLDASATSAQKENTNVFVDVSCPSHD